MPSTNQTQTSVPQFDNTRDAVGYFYDKQHPYGGMSKMTGPLGDISYYDENLHKPKEPQPNAFNNTLQKSEQLASAAYNGLSGGFVDEIGGAINGLGYGAANLGMPRCQKTRV